MIYVYMVSQKINAFYVDLKETLEHYCLNSENHRYWMEQFQTDSADLGLISINMILQNNWISVTTQSSM